MKPSYMPNATLSLDFGMRAHRMRRGAAYRDNDRSERARGTILVVEADSDARRAMQQRLGAYEVKAANDGPSALEACARSRPDLVIVDAPLKDGDSLAFLKALKSRSLSMPVILISAGGSIGEAVRAMHGGAFAYLVKPLDKTELLEHVGRALEAGTLGRSNDGSSTTLSRNQLMKDRLAIANQAAASDEPILLTGEQGTGKEFLARAIHAASARRLQPFVVFSWDPGAMDPSAGALLGSRARGEEHPPGAWQLANGGTLFIDQIDRMPLDVQAMLHQTLNDERACRRSGAARPVRLMCASGRDLRALAESGAFRRNLLDEISILPIEIPPLGRRREDIPLLVSHFLQQATEPHGQRKIFSAEAVQLLATSAWPGNVRQLSELVRDNVASSPTKVIGGDSVRATMSPQAHGMLGYDEARERFARDYLEDLLRRTAGSVSQAARLARRNRSDFYKLLARHQLNPGDFKQPHPARVARCAATAAGDAWVEPGESRAV